MLKKTIELMSPCPRAHQHMEGKETEISCQQHSDC